MNYRQNRGYENLNKSIYPGVGEYGIPQIKPVSRYHVDNWISFNFARSCEDPEVHGIHFFVDDYQFTRVWDRPDVYLNTLRRFQAVTSPDFSTYTDFPKAMQIYNHYRKHWLAAYWQDNGITVIPTISWSDQDSYSWCFDGEPEGSVVAVSSVGTQASQRTKQLFIDGYKEMVNRLHPSEIIMYGSIPDGFSGNIVRVKAFQDSIKDRCKNKNS